ncbi:hypothetical protein C8Q79DRAFT_704836 [Trametes meyenii]|nr:hypothetical protein C8Q79DRAFT_704836 [Trametes meyenii]
MRVCCQRGVWRAPTGDKCDVPSSALDCALHWAWHRASRGSAEDAARPARARGESLEQRELYGLNAGLCTATSRLTRTGVIAGPGSREVALGDACGRWARWAGRGNASWLAQCERSRESGGAYSKRRSGTGAVGQGPMTTDTASVPSPATQSHAPPAESAELMGPPETSPIRYIRFFRDSQPGARQEPTGPKHCPSREGRGSKCASANQADSQLQSASSM